MTKQLLQELKLHHISVSVPDIEQAIGWYGKVLGFEIEQQFEISAIAARGAFLVRDRLRLEIWQLAASKVPETRKDPGSDIETGGTKHMAFLVPNLQRTLGTLIEMGVDIAAVQRAPTEPMMPDSEPLLPSKPPAFAAFIRDPAGILIEILDQERVLAMQRSQRSGGSTL